MSVSETELTRLYAESGVAEWHVSREEFAEWVADAWRRLGHGEATQSLRWREFALAQACAAGRTAAWECFVREYRGKLYAAGIAIARDEVAGRELADSLYGELFARSKFGSFLGRGSLEGWLRTLLSQEQVNRFRRERRTVPFDDGLEAKGAALAESAVASGEEVKLAEATDEALGELKAEDRFVLASYYLDERTLAEIGRMMGVHESTVSRRVEKITAQLRQQIVGLLVGRGVARRAAEEMLAVDVRSLEINVREKLAQERRA